MGARCTSTPVPGLDAWDLASGVYDSGMIICLQKTVILLMVLGKLQTRIVQEQSFIRLKLPFMPG